MTALDADAGLGARLPIWQTAWAGYRDTLANIGFVLAAASLPWAVSTVLSTVLTSQISGVVYELLNNLVEPLPPALFEVIWFRFLLLRTAPSRAGSGLWSLRRLPPYLGYTVLLSLLFLPALLLPYWDWVSWIRTEYLAFTFGVAAYVVATYVYLRLGFVFPWIAVGDRKGLRDSWAQTRGNGLRLLSVTLLIAIPFLLLVALIAGITAAAEQSLPQFLSSKITDPAFWGMNAGLQVAAYLVYAITTAAIAHAFGVLTGWQGNREELLERFE